MAAPLLWLSLGSRKPILWVGILNPREPQGQPSSFRSFISGLGALSVRLTNINVVEVQQRSWLRYRGFTTIKVVQLGTMPQPP